MSFAHHPRWVLHKDKVPYGLNGLWGPVKAEPGTLAQVEALRLTCPGAYGGHGYLPHIEDPLACLDCDNTSNPLWPGLFDTTYCERSFSNVPHKGHAIFTLDRATKQRLKGIRLIAGFELFSDSGFFTVTFNALNDLPLADYSNRLWNLADRFNLFTPSPRVTPSSWLLPIDYLRSALRLINPNCSWNDWFQAIAAIHCATGGSEEGKALLHEWGCTGGKYNDASAKKIEKDWSTLDDSKCRYDPATTLDILQRDWARNTRGMVVPAGWAKANDPR